MSNLKLILFSIGFSLSSFGDEVIRYPFVSQINANVTVKGRTGAVKNLSRGEVLRERALVITGTKSQVRIELDGNNSLILLENSEMEIPVIGSEKGEVSEIMLHSGKLRVISQNANQRYYGTPLTRDIYFDADFLLSYDDKLGVTSITVFRGAIQFRGLENEIDVRVAQGQRAEFHGVLENGEPTFDILLKGRKVARGKLAPLLDLKKEAISHENEESIVHKPAPPKPHPTEIKRPGQICQKPYGKLNECTWVCEGVKKGMKSCDTRIKGVECVRRRCNANGEWADKFILPDGRDVCQIRPRVGPCDY